MQVHWKKNIQNISKELSTNTKQSKVISSYFETFIYTFLSHNDKNDDDGDGNDGVCDDVRDDDD